MKTLLSIIIIATSLHVNAARNIDVLNRRQEILEQQFLKLKQTHPPINLLTYLRIGEKADSASYIKTVKTFLNNYDQFNNDKIDFFLDRLYKRQIKFHKKAQKKFHSKKLNGMMKEITGHYKDYQNRKKYFGTADDFKRVFSGAKVTQNIGKYANLVKEKIGINKSREFGYKLLPFVDNMKELFSVSDELLGLLWQAYFNTTTDKADDAPILEALKKFSKQIAKDRKVETRWDGLQNLEDMSHDGKTAHLFAFMHANSFFDTMTQVEFPVEGLSVVGNIDVIFPKFLAKRMYKADHLITIGQGEVSPKFRDLVTSNKLNKFQVAPEGLTPVGFQEIRPCVDTFAKEIYKIIDEGIELSIYPVSFPGNLKLLNQWRKPIEKNNLSVGVLYPRITADEITRLKSYTGDIQSIAHLVRWNWFQDLKKYSDKPLGMLKPSQMLEQIDFLLWESLDRSLFL